MNGDLRRMASLKNTRVAKSIRQSNSPLLTGAAFDAQRALDLGLINSIVDAAELMPTARAVADEICKAAPRAVMATKRMVNTLDAQEGVAAFVEKRTPIWRGE